MEALFKVTSGCFTYVLHGGMVSSSYYIDCGEHLEGSSFRETFCQEDDKRGLIQDIYSGGVAVSTTISAAKYNTNKSPMQYLNAGGSALHTTIFNGEQMLCGGYSSDTRLNGGEMRILDGAVAEDVTFSAGAVYVEKGTVNKLHANMGKIYVYDGGAIYNLQAEKGIEVTMYSGGLLRTAEIHGYLEVEKGGIMQHVNVGENGRISAYDGVVLRDMTVSSGGMLCLEGNVALGGELQVAGNVFLQHYYSSASLSSTTIEDLLSPSPRINFRLDQRTIGDGISFQWLGTSLGPIGEPEVSMENRFIGIDFCITVDAADQGSGYYSLMEGVESFQKSVSVFSSDNDYLGEVSLSQTLTNGDFQYSLALLNGELKCKVRDTTKSVTDSVKVFSNGVMTTAAPYMSGAVLGPEVYVLNSPKYSMTVEEGGVVDDSFLGYSATMVVMDGGIASRTTLGYFSEMHILKGGKAIATQLTSYCQAHVSSGGLLEGAGEAQVGRIRVSEGGVARNISCYELSSLVVLSGGYAENVDVYSGGAMVVSKGGLGSNIRLRTPSYDQTTVANIFGSVRNAEVFSDTVLWLSSSTVGEEIAVHSGGTLSLDGNTTLSGQLMLGGEIKIHASNTSERIHAENADIVFNLTERNTADGAIIATGKYITFDPLALLGETSYSILVDNDMLGSYALASNVSSMTTSITVKDQSGNNYGCVSVGGEALMFNRRRYSLTLTDGVLALNVALGDIVEPTLNPKASAAKQKNQNVVVSWDAATDNVGIAGYNFRFGMSSDLEGDGMTLAGTSIQLFDLPSGTYYYQWRAFDSSENYSGWSALHTFTVVGNPPEVTVAEASRVTWKEKPDAKIYLVEYTDKRTSGVLTVETSQTDFDVYGLKAGSYSVSVCADINTDWSDPQDIVGENVASKTGNVYQGKTNQADELFFAMEPERRWSASFQARHQGIRGTWSGTGELVSLAGRNRIADVYWGSDDKSILVLTDDAQGDALFVEDLYSRLPESLETQQARISRIDEIRGGAGDDVIDLTSQFFNCTGKGMTLRGGLGNDVLWANKGNNTLFGDAGNDRLVGGSGNDILVGGGGNDSMHGGGGDDIFCLCKAWGQDTVQQLPDGKITLWFDGVERSTLTLTADASGHARFSDGKGDTVTVASIRFSDINAAWGSGGNELGGMLSLKFGDDGSSQYDSLLAEGAFRDCTSERIFEERDKGLLA